MATKQKSPLAKPAPKNGDVVRLHGYEFTVTNVRQYSQPVHGESFAVCRFEGVCTANRVNDTIRRTSYNGGTYGWRID
jgi:hypothetical protein